LEIAGRFVSMTAFNPITAREDASSVGLRKTRRAGQSVLELIGNTPLLRLSRIGNAFPNVEFFAKAEWFNPGGSVKDRPALHMIPPAAIRGLPTP
jgi:threonine dehydratase